VVQPAVDADRGAPWSRPDLDQVAQLVDHPEAAATFVLPLDLPTSDQRVVDPADVADLAQSRPWTRSPVSTVDHDTSSVKNRAKSPPLTNASRYSFITLVVDSTDIRQPP
jgi:hypothetical protein